MDYLRKLYDMMERQRQLDLYIIEAKKIDLHPYDMFTNRCLAFVVELSELANEVRSFKHWSGKPMSEKSVMLEEFVDAMHFLLSISYTVADEAEGVPIEFVFHTNPQDPDDVTKLEVNNTFLALANMTTELYYRWHDKDYYKNMSLVDEMWQTFSILGGLLGFSDEDVDAAYDAKYKKNIERQKEGY